MSRRLCFVLTLGTVVSLVGLAQAQQPDMDGPAPVAQNPPKESWWKRWKRDYHRNACWPEPFIPADRASVLVPFQLMADNGWERQNLLSDGHFVEGTTQLNSAGQVRLMWILTKAPTQRRAVFVERLTNDQATDERIAGVERAMRSLAPDLRPIPVYESNLGPSQWMGEQAEATQRANAKTVPDPRLPRSTTAPIN